MSSQYDPRQIRQHLIPYNYSLVHQSPGIPIVVSKQTTFKLAAAQSSADDTSQQVNGSGGSDSIVTEQLLLQLTDCDALNEIRVISLRNKNLTSCLRILSNCDNITIAYLQGNLLNLYDLMYLQTFKSLKKIDLSYNQIATLPGEQVFKHIHSLKFLYLHNNMITNWADVQSLTSLPSIIHLTLFSNPVCTIPGYRHFLVNSMPSLLALDNFVITDEERIEDASFGYRFRAMNEYMKLHIPDYAKEKSAEQHLFNLEVDIYRLRRIFERNSPAVLIQALYRGYRQRNFVKIYFNERKQKIVKIQKVVRGWLNRKKFKKDLKDMLAYTKQEYLLMTNSEIKQKHAATKIKSHMVNYHRARKRSGLEQSSTLYIQKFFRGRFVKNTSFINILELSKYPRLYFLKEQKPAFIKILKSLLPIFENSKNDEDSIKFDQLFSCIRFDTKYDSIRVAEPDLFQYKSLPLIQFVKPSIISRVRLNQMPMNAQGDDKNNDNNNSNTIFNQDFTLKNMYFSTDKEYTDRKLNIIQKRNCYVKKEKLDKVYDKIKANPYRNQYFFQDQYKDFLVFEPPRLDILITLCFAILDYNKHVNQEEEQQFLAFFEILLIKVSAATKIQQAFRAHLFRKSLVRLPVMTIIQQRAAFCIQRWWSNVRLQKRMLALQKIKRHIDRIKSKEIYIEQQLYEHVSQVITQIHSQMRFEEQHMSFDFSATGNYQIYMTVQEKDSKSMYRYMQLAVPQWFNLNLRAPEFGQSPFNNNMLAFFHFNEGECQILPTHHIVRHNKSQLDIDRSIQFLQIKCSSVEEAKRRATVLAFLTYDIHRHLFLQLSTAEMLEDPFIMKNIYALKSHYRLPQESISEINLRVLQADQQKQQHNGLIITDADARVASTHGSRMSTNSIQAFKKLNLTQRSVMISCKTKMESDTMDRELLNRQQISEIDLAMKSLQPTFYESRKYKEETSQMMKDRRLQVVKESVQSFRDHKIDQKQLYQQTVEDYLQTKKDEVNKAREINKIIASEQKVELNKNLAVFLHLNKEEKALRQELVEKQLEVDYKEKYLKKVNVLQQHKNRQLKKEEQEKFVNSFHQAKNLIEKQIKIGKRIKEQKIVRDANKQKVLNIKSGSQGSQGIGGGGLHDKSMSKQREVLRSVLFDNSLDLDMHQSRQVVQNSKQKSYSSKRTIQQQYATTAADESQYSSRKGMKTAYYRGGMQQQDILANRSSFLPPLHDQSFEQNRSFQHNSRHNNLNQYNNYSQINNNNMYDSEVSYQDIEQVYRTQVSRQPSVPLQKSSGTGVYQKNSINRPIFAEESYPLIKQQNIIGNDPIAGLKVSFDNSKYVKNGSAKSRERIGEIMANQRKIMGNIDIQ